VQREIHSRQRLTVLHAISCALQVAFAILFTRPLLAENAPSQKLYNTQTLASYSFDPATEDMNYDRFPDNWIKIVNDQYPPYVQALLVDDVFYESQGSLVFEMNGENMAVESSTSAVAAEHSYRISGFVNTRGRKKSAIRLIVIWLDKQNHVLDRHVKEMPEGELSWHKMDITVADAPRDSSALKLRLEVSDEDMSGKIWFDDFSVVAWHKIHLKTDQDGDIFYDDQPLKFSLDLSAIPKDDYTADFEILDWQDVQMMENTIPMDTRKHLEVFTLEAPSSGMGYFLARVTVKKDGEPFVSRDLPFGVVDRRPRLDIRESYFGVDIVTRDEDLIRLEPIIKLLDSRWARTDLWRPGLNQETAPIRQKFLNEFMRQMRDLHVKVVALFGNYPAEIFQMRKMSDKPLGWLLVDMSAKAWRLFVTDFMETYGDQVDWWQMGSNMHGGLVLSPEEILRIEALNTLLSQSTFRAHLGMPIHPKPKGQTSDLAFASLRMPGPRQKNTLKLATQILAEHLPQTEFWLYMEDPSKEDISETARQLTLDTLAAMESGFQRLFIPLISENHQALFTKDWHPTPIFFMWRTLDIQLRGKHYQGTFELGEGIENVLFTDQHEAVLFVWKKGRGESIEIFLGQDVEEMDLMGNTKPFSGMQTLVPKDLPRLYTHISPALMSMRLSYQLTGVIIPEIKLQTVHFSVRNTFDVPIHGTTRPTFPPGWKVLPNMIPFEIEAGQSFTGNFQVRPPSNLGGDDVNVTTFLKFRTDKAYNVQVTRAIPIDAEIRVLAKRLSIPGQPHHRIRVSVSFTPKTAGIHIPLIVSVMPPDMQPIERIIPDIKEGKVEEKTFFIPKSKIKPGDVILIRVQEVDGARFSNYNLIVE